jgi:hypothetical protein
MLIASSAVAQTSAPARSPAKPQQLPTQPPPPPSQADIDAAQKDSPNLSQDLAAGATGQPIVWSSPRSDFGIPWENMGFRIGGHIEGGYTYMFDPPPSNFVAGHLYDQNHDDPTLNQANLFLARAVDPSWKKFDVGVKIEGSWGSDAHLNHATGLFDHYQLVNNDPPFFGSFEHFDPEAGPENQFDLTQAYADVAVPLGNGVRIRVGKMAAPVGLETIDPTTTPFYSRSFLFVFGLPTTETGAWVAYHLTDSFDLELGVHRGWNQALEDTNDTLSYHGRIAYSSEDKLTSAALTVQTGPERAGDNDHYRTFADLSVAHRLGLHGPLVAGEVLYGYETHVPRGSGRATSPAQWWALAGYVSVPLERRVDVNFRAEWFHDPQGGRFDQTIYELTGGLAIKPFPDTDWARGLVIRPEIRWDMSDDDIFPENARHNQDNQWTFGIDMLYAF